MLTDTKNEIFVYICGMNIVCHVSKCMVLCHDDDRIINEDFILPNDVVIFHDVFSVLFLQELVCFRDFPYPSFICD